MLLNKKHNFSVRLPLMAGGPFAIFILFSDHPPKSAMSPTSQSVGYLSTSRIVDPVATLPAGLRCLPEHDTFKKSGMVSGCS